MKTLLIYDSAFGNTKRIADAIKEDLEGEVLSLQAEEMNVSHLKDCDLLIVGSPTQGGRPTEAVSNMLNKIPKGRLEGVGVAAFDTRFSIRKQNFGLRMLMKLTGYAAEKIAAALVSKGGLLIEDPQGFIVEKKEGPLRSAEFERARLWGSELQVNLGKAN